MLRSILSVCIMGLSGLLVMAVLLPTQTREAARAVFSNSSSLGTISPLFDLIQHRQVPEQEIRDDVINKKPVTPIETTAKAVIEAILPKKKPETASGNALTAANVIDATNNERIAGGLPPLSTNDKLSASAKLKTQDMIAKGYFEHTSPSGVTVSDLGTAVGYNYVIMGENLALGNFSGADDLVTAWMNSPGHRANILNASYMEIGVYAEQGQYEGRTVWFAVQHFGTARGACPAVNQSLKDDIDTINRSLKAKEKQIITMRAELEAMTDKGGQEYSTRVSAFNTLVASYNAQLATSQQSIAAYNRQVVAFNGCLSKYQKAE